MSSSTTLTNVASSSSSASSLVLTLQTLTPDLSHIKAYSVSVPGIDQSIEIHTLSLPKALYLWCNIQPSLSMDDFTIAVPGLTPSIVSSADTRTNGTGSSSSASVPSSMVLYTSGQVDKDEQESFAKLLCTKFQQKSLASSSSSSPSSPKIIYLSYNVPETVPMDVRMDLQRAILKQILTL